MSGNFTQTQFSININATAFDLLINKLYKDKPQSIIRELVSNAWDAHVDAKTTHIPVQVTLPSYEESTLTIKDFGTGLSPEKMVGLYCTIFMSDRDKTNDFLGGYGLGCKSPFSYTSQYTVQSRWNNVCYTYNIFKSTDGTPTIMLIDESVTDEHNGLTIIVPVKSGDRCEFVEAAKKVLPWFPNIKCDIDIPNHQPVWKQEGVSLYKDLPVGVYAKVGCVLYPLDLYVMNHTLGNTDSYEWKASLVLDVPIGKIGITPAREDLSYDPETIQYLTNYLEEAKSLLQEDAKRIVLNATTYKQALTDCRFLRVVLNNFRWWDDTLRHPSNPSKPFDNRITTTLTNVVKISRLQETRRGFKIDNWRENTELTIHMESELNVFFADPSLKYLAERVRKIPRWSLTGASILVITTNRDKKQYEESTAGKINFFELSNYYIEPRSSKSGNKRATLEVTTYKNDVITIDTSKEFFYLEGKHGYVTLKGTSITSHSLQYAIYRIFDSPIAVVPPSKMPYFKRQKNGVDFNKKFDELCAKWFADTSMWEALAAFINVKTPPCHRYNTLNSLFAKKNPDHPLIKLQKAIERGHSLLQLKQLLNELNITYPNPPVPTEFLNTSETYSEFMEYVSVDTNLLTAFDFYLEQQQNA